MPKIAITTKDDDNSQLLTDEQADALVAGELAEAEVDHMLEAEDVTTIFKDESDSTSPSID
jgi:hypothetical protein